MIKLKETTMTKLKTQLKTFYKKIKKDFLGKQAKLIPEKYWSQFICVGGASEIQYALGRAIPRDKKKILIIGVAGGRDYFYFKIRGHEVFALDLFHDSDFENLTVGNIEEKLPWPDNFFDAIVMMEVLEHLNHDYRALMNVRRILKDDGILALSVPFLNIGKIHARVHHPITTKRFLRAAGFSTEIVLERPNIFFSPHAFNLLHHAFNTLFYMAFRKTLYKKTLPMLWKLDYWLSQRKNPIRKLFTKGGGNWGGCFICKKAETFNLVDANRKQFGGDNPS